jgi:hypothetical protein
MVCLILPVKNFKKEIPYYLSNYNVITTKTLLPYETTSKMEPENKRDSIKI